MILFHKVKLVLLLLAVSMSALGETVENIAIKPAVNSKDIAFTELQAEWKNNPEVKVWFNDWRESVNNAPDNKKDNPELTSEYLLNLPGYVRLASDVETIKVNSILRNKGYDDKEAWNILGVYLNDEFESNNEKAIWQPASAYNPGPQYLINGMAAVNNQNQLEILQKQIKKQNEIILDLAISLKEITKRLEKLEK